MQNFNIFNTDDIFDSSISLNAVRNKEAAVKVHHDDSTIYNLEKNPIYLAQFFEIMLAGLFDLQKA